MEIYSPDLVAAQQEYLVAMRGLAALKDASPEVQANMRRLAEGSLQRLRNWDIADEELAQLRSEGKPRNALTLRSPASGVVLEKPSVQGMRFMPGEVLFKIADLSSVWLLADVFEQDLGMVRVGQAATVRLNAYPETVLEGKVAFIYPTVTAETRTAKVRIELRNPGQLLKPAMYASVELSARDRQEKRLAVPDSAVLDSGTRQIVLVRRGEGLFEPREVKLGTRGDGYVEVLDGVKEGEAVVVSANFLIDAESNLKAAIAGFGQQGQGNAPAPEAAKSHTAEGTVESVDAKTGTVSIAHGPVASLKWPGMTMDFKVKDPALLQGIKAGAKIRFEFAEQAPGEWTVTGVSPAQAGSSAPKRTKGTEMLARIIEWSVRNVFLVLLTTLFIVGAGIYAVYKTPLDAIPDLSDVQVIIYTEYPGQAPQVVEDQVTYPLEHGHAAPCRSPRWCAGSRSSALPSSTSFSRTAPTSTGRAPGCSNTSTSSPGRMPRGVTPTLGPDATGVGWVYQYVVVGAQRTLAELRTIQDWFVRYQLTKAQGVAEVASVGGFVKTYQVTVEPAQAAGLRHSACARRPGDPRQQPRRGRPRDRDGGDRVRRARQGLPARHRRYREPGGQGREGHAGPDPGHRARGAGAGRTARDRRAGRRGRGGGGHRRRALRAERPRRDSTT